MQKFAHNIFQTLFSCIEKPCLLYRINLLTSSKSVALLCWVYCPQCIQKCMRIWWLITSSSFDNGTALNQFHVASPSDSVSSTRRDILTSTSSGSHVTTQKMKNCQGQHLDDVNKLIMRGKHSDSFAAHLCHTLWWTWLSSGGCWVSVATWVTTGQLPCQWTWPWLIWLNQKKWILVTLGIKRQWHNCGNMPIGCGSIRMASFMAQLLTNVKKMKVTAVDFEITQLYGRVDEYVAEDRWCFNLPLILWLKKPLRSKRQWLQLTKVLVKHWTNHDTRGQQAIITYFESLENNNHCTREWDHSRVEAVHPSLPQMYKQTMLGWRL